jgi:hypothetical protein
VFDQAFHVFWKKPKMLEQLMQLMFHQITRAAGDKPKDPGFRRLAEAMFDQSNAQSRREKPEVLELDATFTASADDILRAKDFEQMTLTEQIQAKEAIARLRLQRREFLTRRFQPDQAGARIDMRRTLRQSLRSGGHMIDLARRAPKPPAAAGVPAIFRPVSATAAFLHFLVNDRTDVTVFLGTRLTNITANCTLTWMNPSPGGGEGLVSTRSAPRSRSSITRGRRVLTQGADVLLMTDGLERDDTDQLTREMQRLRRSAKKIVWLNPLLRFDRFEAKASGIRAMMPYVDEFRPVHSLNSLSDLAEALGKRAGPAHDPRKWLKAA